MNELRCRVRDLETATRSPATASSGAPPTVHPVCVGAAGLPALSREQPAPRARAAAVARGFAVEDAVVEALTEWTDQHTGEFPALTFVGIGEGRADLAEHHDEILVEHLRDAS